jgi:hypothetical protein
MSVRNFGLTDFRPLPSPAVNHYSIGFSVVAEQSTGYPGYDSLGHGRSRTSERGYWPDFLNSTPKCAIFWAGSAAEELK